MRKAFSTKAVFITILAMSTGAQAWDSKTYEQVRETAVLKISNNLSSQKGSDGVLRHFSWDSRDNTFAESLAAKIAQSEDAAERAKRLNTIFNELAPRFNLNEAKESSYNDHNPHVNAQLAWSLAEQASKSAGLTKTFLEFSRGIPDVRQGGSAEIKANYLTALERAIIIESTPSISVEATASRTYVSEPSSHEAHATNTGE
ncbi:MAG TPA: hypothetical protein VM901_08395 [Bdellovibrionota bacterium]|nr:hypothetical protein [Bdellovibrionota bacterium]